MSDEPIDLAGLRHDHHGCRLCVRQRAEAADEIERLRAAQQVLPRCRTEHPDNRFWECERPAGHQGPHVAPIEHVEWEEGEA